MAKNTCGIAPQKMLTSHHASLRPGLHSPKPGVRSLKTYEWLSAISCRLSAARSRTRARTARCSWPLVHPELVDGYEAGNSPTELSESNCRVRSPVNRNNRRLLHHALRAFDLFQAVSRKVPVPKIPISALKNRLRGSRSKIEQEQIEETERSTPLFSPFTPVQCISSADLRRCTPMK